MYGRKVRGGKCVCEWEGRDSVWRGGGGKQDLSNEQSTEWELSAKSQGRNMVTLI